jgi:DNA ligase 1
MITRPMLAGTVKDIGQLKYPLLGTPKLDGIRCLIIKGKAVSRNFKPIPNVYTRNWLEKNLPSGADGELILRGNSFQAVESAVMSEAGEPDVFYYVFDRVVDSLKEPYHERIKHLYDLKDIDRCHLVLPKLLNNELEVLAFEEMCLADDYEGVMLRCIDGPYKCGRSTLNEHYLLKLKRFEDAEATVLDFLEKMHNTNEAKEDAFGHSKRSSHKDNKIPANTLGSLVVQDIKTNLIFNIGTGFDDSLRAEIWSNRDKYRKKLVKYKYQSKGVKDLPRFPVFLSFRHENDM